MRKIPTFFLKLLFFPVFSVHCVVLTDTGLFFPVFPVHCVVLTDTGLFFPVFPVHSVVLTDTGGTAAATAIADGIAVRKVGADIT